MHEKKKPRETTEADTGTAFRVYITSVKIIFTSTYIIIVDIDTFRRNLGHSFGHFAGLVVEGIVGSQLLQPGHFVLRTSESYHGTACRLTHVLRERIIILISNAN